jgi:hypothetical protein
MMYVALDYVLLEATKHKIKELTPTTAFASYLIKFLHKESLVC